MKIFIKLTAFVMAMLQIFVLFACDDGREYYVSDNYSQYVSQLVQYAFADEDDNGAGDAVGLPIVVPEEGGENKANRAPEIDGLVAVYEFMFDKATNFFGKHAYVELNGDSYIFNESGTMEKIIETESDNDPEVMLDRIVYDKIVINKSGVYGVLDLNGNVIVDPEYDNIDILESLIVASRNSGGSDIFVNNKLVKSAFGNGDVVSIVSDKIIACGNKFYFVNDFMEAKLGKYFIADAPADGKVTVRDADGNFGYCSYPDGNVIIEPKYFLASEFSNGYAVVNMLSSDVTVPYQMPMIIDASDRLMVDFSKLEALAGVAATDIKVYGNHDNYNVYYVKHRNVYKYGVVDFLASTPKCFEISFVPKNNRVYANYLIDNMTGRFYSLKEEKFADGDLSYITRAGNYFIAKSAEAYYLLDDNLKIKVTCERIENYGNILLMKLDGKYAYYRV